MKISEIAKASGLTVKSIRYYESVGLLPNASRNDNGYRHYDDALLPTLRLISKARQAGFSVSECEELVALFNNPERHSAEVHEVVKGKIVLIDKQLKELGDIREHLVAMANTCANDSRSKCTILESLSNES